MANNDTSLMLNVQKKLQEAKNYSNGYNTQNYQVNKLNLQASQMPTQETSNEEETKEKRGFLGTVKSIYGTSNDVMSSVTEGVFDAFDSISDGLFAVMGWVGSLFGGDTQWAENIMQYDWVTPTNDAFSLLDPANLISVLATGEAIKDFSYLNDLDTEKQEKVRGVANTVGQMAPSVIAAIMSGGASVGVQAGVQGGVGLVKEMGSSMESSLDAGNSYNESMGYAALKGTVSGGISAASTGLGQFLSNSGGTVAEKVGTKFASLASKKGFSDGIAKVINKVTTIGINAISEGLEEGIETMADPLLQQITINSNALEEKYGTGEIWEETATSVMYGALFSVALDGLGEIKDVSNYGSDGYMVNYYNEKLKRSIQDYNNLAKQADKIDMNNDAAIAKALAKADKIQKDIDTYTNKAEFYAKKLKNTGDANNPTHRDIANDELTTELLGLEDAANETKKVKSGNTNGRVDKDFAENDYTNRGKEISQDTSEIDVRNTELISNNETDVNTKPQGDTDVNVKPRNLDSNAKPVDTDTNVKPKEIDTNAKPKEVETSKPKEVEGKPIDYKPNGETAQATTDAADLRADRVISQESSNRVIENTFNEATLKVKDLINTKVEGSDNVTIKLNNPKSKLAKYTFQDFNNWRVKDKKQLVADLTYEITNAKIEYTVNGVKKSTTFESEFGAEQFAKFKKDVNNILTTSLNGQSRKGAYKSMQEKLQAKIKYYSDLATETHKVSKEYVKMTNNKKKLATLERDSYEWTNDNKTYHSTSLLSEPILKAHYSDGNITSEGLITNLDKVLDNYNAEKWNYDYEANKDIEIDNHPVEPFNAALYDTYARLRESLGDDPDAIFNLNSEQVALLNRASTILTHMQKNAMSFKKQVTPLALESTRFIDGGSNNVFQDALYSVGRLSVPVYEMNSLMFRADSPAYKVFTKDIASGDMKMRSYVGTKKKIIADKVKELKVKKDLTKKVTILGHKMTVDQALDIYMTLEYNGEVVSKRGLYIKGKRNPEQLISLQYLKQNDYDATKLFQQVEQELKAQVGDNVFKYADFVGKMYNSAIRKEYMVWYKQAYGVDTNELEAYYPMWRYDNRTKTSEMAVAHTPTFGNSVSRVNSDKAVICGSITNKLTNYIENFGREQFLMPQYRKAIGMLNSRVVRDTDSRITFGQKVRERFGDKGYKYIVDNLNRQVGLNLNNKNKLEIVNKLMSGISASQLGGLHTAIIQHGSLYVSNLTLGRAVNGTLERLFGDKEFKAELQTLMDETALSFRGTEALNVNTLGESHLDITKYTTGGITLMDKFTMQCGLSAVMNIAEKEMGLKLGTPEFRQFVIENYANFELSQVSSNTLGSTTISRGDAGETVRAMFSYLQGANRALVGANVRKADLWLVNRKKKIEDIESRIDKTKAISEEAEANLDLELEIEQELYAEIDKLVDQKQGKSAKEKKAIQEKIDETREKLKQQKAKLETAEQNYEKAKGKYEGAICEKECFQEYKLAGGKAMPVQLAASMTAYAIFTALIHDFRDKTYGKKDWDEFDIQEMGMDAFLNATVNWVPVVNQIANYLKGNEMEIPLVEFFNQASGLVNYIKENQDGKYDKKIMSTSLQLASSITGIPLTTYYKYVTGVTRAFDYETYLRERNFLYGVTISTETQALNDHLNAGDTDKARQDVSFIMETYKSGKVSDDVRDELTTLLSEDYSVMPSSIPTSITANGLEITLDSSQKTLFKTTYSKSNSLVAKLIKNATYKALDEELKASAINYTYNAYYDAAKAKISTNYTPSSKASYLVSYSNVDLSKYSAIVTEAKSLEATKTTTKKELVANYINTNKNLTKEEKLLAIYLSGYSLTDENKVKVRKYLMNKGMTQTQAKEFLKESK